jgi:hypothetical protein
MLLPLMKGIPKAALTCELFPFPNERLDFRFLD